MGIGLKTFVFYNLGSGKRIPAIKATDPAFPQDLNVDPGIRAEACGGLSPQEGLWLVRLAAHMRCNTVFEIGTCSGKTTYNLALNVPGVVYTLDLPPNTRTTLLPVENQDYAFMGVKDDEKYWLGKSPADRIIPLRGDSANYDFSPYHKRVDLVFVDGSHAYEYVCKDSESALAMIRDRGIIIWHDYAPCWPGVVRALNRLALRVPLCRLRGTSLVIYRREGRL